MLLALMSERLELTRRDFLKISGFFASLNLLPLLSPNLPPDEEETEFTPVASYFIHPVDGFTQGGNDFLDTLWFGNASGVYKTYHPGFDYNVGYGNDDLGMELKMIGNGKCLLSRLISEDGNSRNGYGECLIFMHALPTGEKVYSRYAHLAQRSVGLGEIVEQGRVVGTIGKSGGMEYSHLHLEIFKEKYYTEYLVLKPGYSPQWWSKEQILEYFFDPLGFIESRLAIKGPDPRQELPRLKTRGYLKL